MEFKEASSRFIESYGVKNLDPSVRPVGVKFITNGDPIPNEFELDDISTPWCGAVKSASEGEPVVMTKENIGCPAGGIALGLVEPYQDTPLIGERKYTSLMENSATPADFTKGLVYACKDADHMDFALFGKNDSGRYKTIGAAITAVSGMASINNEAMRAVIAYSAKDSDLIPDIVILPLTPKQAMRAIQGYCYPNGNRIELNTIGIRGVCADLTAYPFIHQKLNGSFFCLGARAIAGWNERVMALGMPYSIFEEMTEGMEESKNGFPYEIYPN